jgi:hypothetical protein
LTTASATAQDRIYRHQHAAEVLRARSVLVVACTLWLVVGGGLDLATHHAIGSGSLWFVLTVRVAATAFHIAVVAPLFRNPLPAPRVAMALAASVFPVTAVALMLIATHMGGLTSPYVTAIFVAIAVQAIALPWPWQRGAALVAVTTFIYPVGLLVATRFDDRLRAQLHDDHSMFVFAVFVAVLIAGAIVVAWGGHVIWSLRQSVFESRKLGRYRLLKKIGQGGMGEVWRAEDRALRRNVALKILSPEHGRKPSRVARFEREIQATASIAHPNVVRIHDWGVTDDGVWYYAMDLLEGEDLATVVKRCGPLPAALAVHLFVPAATGLGEAHRIGIVHRDVKPGNMFVVAPGNEPQRLELLDFGIADVSADVYGFAAALFFALTGKTPRDAGGLPVSALVPGVPAAVDDALVRALDADPARRHATANELAGALSAGASAWTGSWKIDREAPPQRDAETVEQTTDGSATGDTEALPTQVEARISSSLIPRSRPPAVRK